MSAETYETILYEIGGQKNGICRITLNRPEKYNAIDRQMAKELVEAFPRNLKSAWQYRYHGVNYDGSRSGTHDLLASLSHQLYASLRSMVSIEGSLRDLTGIGSSSERSGRTIKWSENYSKRLSTWGRLRLDSGLSLLHGRYGAPPDTSLVGEQTITLKDGNIVFLAEPNIDRSSIVISDSSGTISYMETLDYTVVQQGVSTEIRRVSGGTIPDGASVLVEYTAENQAVVSGLLGGGSAHHNGDLIISCLPQHCVQKKEFHVQ